MSNIARVDLLACINVAYECIANVVIFLMWGDLHRQTEGMTVGRIKYGRTDLGHGFRHTTDRETSKQTRIHARTQLCIKLD